MHHNIVDNDAKIMIITEFANFCYYVFTNYTNKNLKMKIYFEKVKSQSEEDVAKKGNSDFNMIFKERTFFGMLFLYINKN